MESFLVVLLLISLPGCGFMCRILSITSVFIKKLTSNCSSQSNGLITRYGKGKFRKVLSHKLDVENGHNSKILFFVLH